jgi:mannose-6-phosphate isomerase-like protein (cupin superfamily)
MRLFIAGTGADGRSAVTRTEDLAPQPMSTMWKTTELPPRVDRSREMERFDIGLAPGEASWMIVNYARHFSTEMHRTNAASFTTVVAGSLVLVLEAERVPLQAGDCLALLGVPHAWETGDQSACVTSMAFGLEA